MRLEFAFLAEAAEARDGRFFVFGGGLTILRLSGTPAMLPAVSLLVKCSLELEEWQRGALYTVAIRKPSGEFLSGKVSATMTPGSPDVVEGRPIAHILVFGFKAMMLEEFGRYDFVIEVDGTEIGQTSFYCDPVTEATNQEGTAQEASRD